MELKDYIHYYLGCKCWTYSGKGHLQDFDIKTGYWYVGLDSGGGTVGNINDTYRECPEESKNAFPDGYPPKSILKPILRKLEDITDEEIKELIGWDKLHELYVAVNFERCVDGVVVYYGIDAGEDHGGVFHQTHKITFHVFSPKEWVFLLSKGFDLFKLIENGLAIDSKTIK